MADATHGSGAPEAAPTSPPHVAAAWPRELEWPADDAPPIDWARFYAQRLGWVVRPTAGGHDRWTYARKLEREAFDDLRERYRRDPTEDERAAIWDDARDIAEKASKGPLGFIKCPANADECDEAYLVRCWGGKHGHERGICIMPGRSSRGFPVVLVDVDVGHDDSPPGDLDGPWGAGLPGPKSRTPRGGMHTLVLSLGGERSSGGRAGLAQGVDVIGCGNTAINVPAGSATPLRRWTSKAPPVMAPEALRRPPTWRAPGVAGSAAGADATGSAWTGPGAQDGGSGRAAEALRTVHAKGSRGRACGTIVGMLARRGALPEDVVQAVLEVLTEDMAGRDAAEEKTRAEMARWRRLLTVGPRDRAFACEVIEAWSSVRDGEGGRKRWSFREARMQARSHWDTASRRQEGEVGTVDYAASAEGVGDERTGASGRDEREATDGLHQHDDRSVGHRVRADVPQVPRVAAGHLDGQRGAGRVVVEGEARQSSVGDGGGTDAARGAVGGLDAERDVTGDVSEAAVLSQVNEQDGHAGKVAREVPPAPHAPPAPQVDVVASAPAKDVGAKIDEARLRRLLPTLGQAYTAEHMRRDMERTPLRVDALYPFADFRTGENEHEPGPGHGMGAAFSKGFGGLAPGDFKVLGAPGSKTGKTHTQGQMVEGLALGTAARILGDPAYAHAPIVLPVWISEMPKEGEAWLRMCARHYGFDLACIADGSLAEEARGVQHMANELQWTAYDVVRHARALCEWTRAEKDKTPLGFALEYLVREIDLSALPAGKGRGRFREDPRSGPELVGHVVDAVALYRRDLAALLGVAEEDVLPLILLDPGQRWAGEGDSPKQALDALLAAGLSRVCKRRTGLGGVLLATSDTTKAATRMDLAHFLSASGRELTADIFAGSQLIPHAADVWAVCSDAPPAGVLRTTQYARVLLGRTGAPAECYPFDWEMHTGRFRARPSEPLRPPVDPEDRQRQGRGGGGGSSPGHGRPRSPSGPGVGDDPGPRRYGTPPNRAYGRTDD